MGSNVRRAIGTLVAICAVSIGGLAYRWLEAASADPRPSVIGVRLGMTAEQVRARVDTRGPGTWTTRLRSGDWVLEHRTGDESDELELHDGQLVAVRVDAPARADLLSGPDRQVTPGSVLVRARAGDRVRLTLLSRACPTHHEEAERLVAGGVPGP